LLGEIVFILIVTAADAWHSADCQKSMARWRGDKRLRSLILLTAAAIGLAACAPPALNGTNDAVTALPGEPHVTHPTAPYDNTAKSPKGTYMGGGDG
jgi:hypothetical protein